MKTARRRRQRITAAPTSQHGGPHGPPWGGALDRYGGGDAAGDGTGGILQGLSSRGPVGRRDHDRAVGWRDHDRALRHDVARPDWDEPRPRRPALPPRGRRRPCPRTATRSGGGGNTRDGPARHDARTGNSGGPAAGSAAEADATPTRRRATKAGKEDDVAKEEAIMMMNEFTAGCRGRGGDNGRRRVDCIVL